MAFIFLELPYDCPTSPHQSCFVWLDAKQGWVVIRESGTQKSRPLRAPEMNLTLAYSHECGAGVELWRGQNTFSTQLLDQGGLPAIGSSHELFSSSSGPPASRQSTFNKL